MKHRRPPSAPTAPAAPLPRPLRLATMLGVLAAVAVAYLPSLRGAYLFDDHDALRQNPALARPWELAWLTTVPPNSTLMGRPVLSWSFGLNALVTGHSPSGYHVANLLIHLGNVALLAALALRGLRAAGVGERAAWAGAWTAAGLWGLHPLNVQAVAYLVQRAESLATAFVLLTLWAYRRRREGGGPAWMWIAGACALLAAGTKETGWIAPLLPLLWAWVFEGRSPGREVVAHGPFYLAGLAGWAWLAWLVGSGGRTAHLNLEPGLNAWTYLLTQTRVLVHYVRLLVWPVGQSFDYDWPLATPGSAWPFLVGWSALLALATWAAARRLAPGFPALTFFLSLAVSSSVIALPDLAYEHRFYLAGGCVWVIVAGAAARFLPRWARVQVVVASVVAVLLGVLTWQRCTLFQSEPAVWQEAVARNPNQRRALSNLAGFDLQEGRPRQALERLRRVEALGIPRRMTARIAFQTGNALLDLRQPRAAQEYYRKALAVLPDDHRIRVNLGLAHLQAGEWAAAREQFERALHGLPRDPLLHFDLAYACLRLGDRARAEEAYRAGLRLGGRPQAALRKLLEAPP